MKYAIIAAIALVLVPITPPPPLDTTLEPGRSAIGWENSVDADTVVVSNPANTACPEPTNERIIAHDTQVSTWVPNNDDENCLLRPGDRIYLELYRAGELVGEIGPYLVPVRVWLPAIR